MASFVGSSSSFISTTIPNFVISKPSNYKPLLIIKSARDRSKPSSGGGAQINSVSRSSGVLLRTSELIRAQIRRNNQTSFSTNFVDPNNNTEKSTNGAILDGDDDDATILKVQSTLN